MIEGLNYVTLRILFNPSLSYYYMKNTAFLLTIALVLFCPSVRAQQSNVGVGAEPPEDATVLFDGSREMLDEKWTYWEGPRFSASLPIKWEGE